MNRIYWMEKIKTTILTLFVCLSFWFLFIATTKFTIHIVQMHPNKNSKHLIPDFENQNQSKHFFAQNPVLQGKEGGVCVCSCNRRLHCGLLFQPQTQEIAAAATSALSTTTGISCHYWDSARRSSHTFLAEAAEKALLSACAPATTVVFL